MEDQDAKFHRWNNERKKGKFRFVLTSTLKIGIFFILGKILGTYLFGNESLISNMWYELPQHASIAFLIGFPMGFIDWYIREWLHRKNIARRKHI
ncbi:hypothetical protein VTH8203_04324 [Vibrio thalassae]|uniref:Uncharacterized protein n=1 Tax=Vibrio thalassae TaxID=1243014 RepID=A0A240EQU7_9VIBR|nr:hypothetical protein [Vibrio thalassae]SNX50663.1 hypothetical protein VTH8203_04324 [Vibrio thalassae]